VLLGVALSFLALVLLVDIAEAANGRTSFD
jgi:hypothetical protein